MEEPNSNKIYFSLGFRCSSASILKRLNLKHESYPFDWLVSNLDTVKHCLEDGFTQFLKQDNYERKYTNTYELAESHDGFICDEHIMANMFYQPPNMQTEENTYKWALAMNHHNIKESNDDYEYYSRCVKRMESMLQNPTKKTFIHIAPAMKLTTYTENIQTILKQMIDFDDFMAKKTENINGLFFILIKGVPYEDPRCLYKTDKGSKIWEIKVADGFVDAGENFMGDCDKVIEFIQNTILEK
jgi:hypothetical protein